MKFILLRDGSLLTGHLKLNSDQPARTQADDGIDDRTDKTDSNATWNLALSETIEIALQNAKVVRSLGSVVTADDDSGLLIARVNEDISIDHMTAAVRGLVNDVEEAYWNLWGAHADVDTAMTARDAAHTLWRENVTNQEDEEAEPHVHLREQYFLFRSQLEKSLQNLQSCEQKLRYLIGIAHADGRVIRPSDNPPVSPWNPDWDRSLTDALANDPQLQKQRNAVRKAQLQLTGAKQALAPELHDDREDNPEVQAVLSTIGHRLKLAEQRNAQLRLAQARAVLEELELEVAHRLTTAFRELDTTYATFQTHFQRHAAAKIEDTSKRNLHRSGQTSLDTLLVTQRHLVQSKYDLGKAMTQYAKAMKKVRYSLGSLSTDRGVTFADDATD